MSLDQLGPDQRLPELSFDLPASRATADLVAAACDAQARFGSSYSPALSSLSINSRGFLTGSIDLAFQDPQHKRWWVLDWKSNWIGERRTGAEPGLCGPLHYSQDAMEDQMLHHHYPLQAHLYLVASTDICVAAVGLLPGASSGGYVYRFLWGMPGPVDASPGALSALAASSNPCPLIASQRLIVPWMRRWRDGAAAAGNQRMALQLPAGLHAALRRRIPPQVENPELEELSVTLSRLGAGGVDGGADARTSGRAEASGWMEGEFSPLLRQGDRLGWRRWLQAMEQVVAELVERAHAPRPEPVKDAAPGLSVASALNRALPSL